MLRLASNASCLWLSSWARSVDSAMLLRSGRGDIIFYETLKTNESRDVFGRENPSDLNLQEPQEGPPNVGPRGLGCGLKRPVGLLEAGQALSCNARELQSNRSAGRDGPCRDVAAWASSSPGLPLSRAPSPWPRSRGGWEARRCTRGVSAGGLEVRELGADFVLLSRQLVRGAEFSNHILIFSGCSRIIYKI